MNAGGHPFEQSLCCVGILPVFLLFAFHVQLVPLAAVLNGLSSIFRVPFSDSRASTIGKCMHLTPAASRYNEDDLVCVLFFRAHKGTSPS